ncbi:hypothetical protein CASFOL_029052 [Castilleja foliolosa]|uniref:Uncharacterized protein n=1 Tax=Castilleja foliolosa TaxID=1961234 RepID=A0ABD3CDR6_9LAMI
MASYNLGHVILFSFTLVALFISHECYADEMSMRVIKQMMSTKNVVTNKINVNFCGHTKHCKTEFCWCCFKNNRCYTTEGSCITYCKW